MKIEWETPPPAQGGGIRYAELLQELKKHPGKWGIVKRNASPSSASQLRRGRQWAGFEIVTRKNTIYARWVGDK